MLEMKRHHGRMRGSVTYSKVSDTRISPSRERRDAVAQRVAVEEHQSARRNLHRAGYRRATLGRACAVRSRAGTTDRRSRPAAACSAGRRSTRCRSASRCDRRGACRSRAHRRADRRPATAASCSPVSASSQRRSAGERYSSAMNGASWSMAWRLTLPPCLWPGR